MSLRGMYSLINGYEPNNNNNNNKKVQKTRNTIHRAQKGQQAKVPK